MENESPKPVAARLSTAQLYQCCDWLKTNWEMIEEQRPARYQIAGQMQEALGFRVSGGSLPKLAEAIGKTLPTARPRKVKETRKYVDRTAILAKIVRILFTKLGEDEPEDLQAIIAGRRSKRTRRKAEAEPAPETDEAAEYEYELDGSAEPAPAPATPPTPAVARPSRREVDKAKRKLRETAQRLRSQLGVEATDQQIFDRLDVRLVDTLRRANELDNQLILAGFDGVVTERQLRGL
jgi:hypothetical protein